MGSPEFAGSIFTALLERRDLVTVTGVVTQPDKPAGRGQKLTAPPVKLLADQYAIPVLQPSKMKTPETLASIAALAPELIVVAAYGRILPPTLLALPVHGCLNVHASLLPRHRGASPIAHAILLGDTDSGVSIMRMEEGLDTGPVYGMRSIPIVANDTGLTLSVKLAELGSHLLLELLPAILSSKLVPQPQPALGVTYAKLLSKSDGSLDVSADAAALARRVRAMIPWPLAFLSRANERIQVLAAHAGEGHGESGRVLAAGSSGVTVACGKGVLILDSVKPAGKSAMSAAAWAAGRGVAVGDLFTSP